MRSPGVPRKLQEVVRQHFADRDAWAIMAKTMGVTEKALYYSLHPKSPREMTYNFIGLLAVKFPHQWSEISDIYHHR